jgi:hypothetical protein
MTVTEFWEQYDYVESAFTRGVIDRTQLMPETILLGWKWHQANGTNLPVRPL